MPNIPKRLAVMQRLQTLLEIPMTIHDVNVDLSGNIQRGRSLVGVELEGHRLAILESPRPDFSVYAGYDKLDGSDFLTLLIQGTCPDDALNPSDEAYWFHAAVVERLAWIAATSTKHGMPLHPEHYMLSNGITDMEISPPVVRPPEDKPSAWAFFYLVVRFGMAGDIGKPYTSVL